MKRKITLAILLVLVVVGGLAGVKVLQIRSSWPGPRRPFHRRKPSSSAVVRQEQWQGSMTAIGTITAVQGITVTPEIPGTVREIAFESGAVVTNGALLVRLDISSEEASSVPWKRKSSWPGSMWSERATFEPGTPSRNPSWMPRRRRSSKPGNADTIRATIEKKTIRAPFAGRLAFA